MSRLSYEMQLRKYQKKRSLTDKQLNKLDVKHNDVNLINQLRLLKSAPAGDTGFWGDFVVYNGRQAGSSQRHMHVYLAYNDVPLTASHQINSNHNYTFTIAEEDRLPLPSSTLQLKVTMQNGTQELDLGAYEGFTITGITENPLNEENTLSMLVNSNNLDEGNCAMTFLVTYVPPASGWSGTITFNRTAGGGTQFIYLRTNTGVIASNYTYTGANAFSVSLANAQSYVEIALNWEGYWELNTAALEPYVATPYVYYEDGLTWNRYNILPNIQSNLAFNFTTFYND